jgi:hypothetical protein
MADGFSHFNWDSLVAIGTLALALVTGFLAWKTKGLADQTAEEVASEARPVLVPGKRGEGSPLLVNLQDRGLRLWIHNAGRGPALDVQALLQPGNREPTIWNKAAVSPDVSEVLQFTDVPFAHGVRMTVRLTYRDLAERTFESLITLEHVPEQARTYFPTEFRCADVDVRRVAAKKS